MRTHLQSDSDRLAKEPRRLAGTTPCRATIRRLSWTVVLSIAQTSIRAFDVLVSLAVLLGSCWYWLPRLAMVGSSGLQRTTRRGRDGLTFNELAFPPSPWSGLRRCGVDRLPVFFNVLRGDLGLVGPRAAIVDKIPSDRRALVWTRQTVRPGLISLWNVRERANIAYDDEWTVDAEYVGGVSLRGNLSLLARAALVSLYGAVSKSSPKQIKLLRLRLDNVSLHEALEQILEWTAARYGPSKVRQVCFVNADCVNIAQQNPDYRSALEQADLVLGDGIGVKLGLQLLGHTLRQNVNGTDLFPRLCQSLSGRPERLFLLGAQPGVAEAVKAWVQQHYPGVQISGTQHGFYEPAEEAEILARIARSGAEILLVAYGAPRQELWIRQHLPATGVRVALGVGGLFDFYSGRIPRAPQWLRELGLEWTFRLYQEPRRMWKRYLWGNLVFLGFVARERVSRRARRSGLA